MWKKYDIWPTATPTDHTKLYDYAESGIVCTDQPDVDEECVNRALADALSEGRYGSGMQFGYGGYSPLNSCIDFTQEILYACSKKEKPWVIPLY